MRPMDGAGGSARRAEDALDMNGSTPKNTEQVNEILEREIEKVRGRNGMGYFEARDRVYAANPDLLRAYRSLTLGGLPRR